MPDVSCRRAYEVLRVAWDNVPFVPIRRGDEYLEGPLDSVRRAFRDELRTKLEASGIAQRLPGGLSEFPDIYASLPPLLGWLARRSAPRNYRQLYLHLLRNLDWYLGASLKPSRVELPWGWISGFMLLLLGGFYLAGLGGLGAQWSGGLFGIIMIVLSSGLRISLTQATVAPSQSYESIKAIELYYYLRETYSDAPEVEGQELLPTAELLAEKQQRELEHKTLRTD